MSTSIPEILNPLKHSGTNRFERLGKELDFDYVQIEERHEADFIQQAEKLSSAIQFYNQNDTPSGDWSVFFDQQADTNQPHRALFIAFLRLIEALNEHANGLTKRHLDYYYQEVLQFGEKEVAPAHVHLFFKCAKTLKERFLENEALLSAGENEAGKKILFQLVNELVVNNTEVNSYFALYKHTEDYDNRIFSKDYSASLIPENKEGFPTFGEQQLSYKKDGDEFVATLLSPDDYTMDEATVGFAVSSSMLRLAEGVRTIQLRFLLEGSYPTDFTTGSKLFKFELTTADGWYELLENEEDITNIVTRRGTNHSDLEIELRLKEIHPAIVNCDQEIHESAYNSPNPVIRITLKHDAESAYGYKAWKNTTVKNIGLKVAVTGVRSLLVQNELSTLDASKPFRPFGPIPSVGNHFYIGHSEIFKHRFQQASINIKWKGLPFDGFAKHYDAYEENITNSSFKISTQLLENRAWQEMHSAVNLFPTVLADGTTTISFDSSYFENYQRKTDNKTLKEWDYTTNYGFLRLNLDQPNKSNFQAFGHSVYPKEVMRNSQLSAEDTPLTYTVEQPYSPMIESLLLNYETTEELFSDHEEDQFYQINPFGEKPIALDPFLVSSNLLPHYTDEGEFYIGLKEVLTPQTVSLLFQLVEGSGDADQSQINTAIEWFYLAKNEWKPIDKLRISKDTTNGLLKTGIIHFDLPTDCDSEHQVMPTDLFWLKASIPEKGAGIDRIQNIYTQGVEAIEQTPTINNNVITANTISKLYNGGKGIASVTQPAASFGGTIAEGDATYYARVSERLRHKDRGITIWDYERLVLDAFPELYKVKCLNHTNYQTEMVAGHVMLAVIPNLRNKNEQSSFQPKLAMYKRMDIYDYLRERISPFIYLRVENPIYEPIQVSFNVGFHEGYDEGFYGKKLHQQLQEFLSPWAFESVTDENTDLVFGGELHKSTILKFIEDLAYVDFVNDFNMYHTYEDIRIHDHFTDELSAAPHSSATKTGIVNTIKIAFQAEDTAVITSLIEIKVRFLDGLFDTTSQALGDQFLNELTTMLDNRAKKGTLITKTLVRSLVKSIYYVDKIASISFYKDLPNGFVQEDVDVAIAKTSRSIMVTSEQHQIGVYKAGDFKCEGNLMIGIGFMIIEADFIIPAINQENNNYATR